MGDQYINTEPLQNLDSLSYIDNPEHWINYLQTIPQSEIAFQPLNSGIGTLDLLQCPPQIYDDWEWLAFLLHNLIDRVSIFYDFAKLMCNDGHRTLNFNDPLIYGTDITLANVGEPMRQALMTPKQKCVGRVKVGSCECFLVNQDLIQKHPVVSFPNMVADFHSQGIGASSYILCMIEELKEMRADPAIFPYKMDDEINQTSFRQAAKYIIYHLSIIMSHITECHIKEIADQQLNRHLFSLNLWIFLVGLLYGILPRRWQMSTEFVVLCRHLFYVDFYAYHSETTTSISIPVEGSREAPAVGAQGHVQNGAGGAQGHVQNGAVGAQGHVQNGAVGGILGAEAQIDNSNISGDTAATEETAIIPRGLPDSPETSSFKARSHRKGISRTNCTVSESGWRRPRQKSSGKKKTKRARKNGGLSKMRD